MTIYFSEGINLPMLLTVKTLKRTVKHAFD